MILRSLYLIGQSTIYQSEPFRNVSPPELEKITTSQRKKGFQRIGLSTRNEWSTIASIGRFGSTSPLVLGQFHGVYEFSVAYISGFMSSPKCSLSGKAAIER